MSDLTLTPEEANYCLLYNKPVSSLSLENMLQCASSWDKQEEEDEKLEIENVISRIMQTASKEK
jgi:hypothetical protein